MAQMSNTAIFVKEMWWEDGENGMDFHIIDKNDKHIIFKNAKFVGYNQELNDDVIKAQELAYHADVRL